MDARLAPTMKTYLFAWMGMLLLVAVEVLATYAHPAVGTLLATLLVLALLEAAVALLYFMHLKYERRALLLWTVPLVVFALVMLDHVWPDAMRLAAMRLH
jgi:heme/copper-type cytochrome/quinol oxidase subunit 4